LSLAPSLGPVVTVSSVNPRNITYIWTPLICIERNGEITGYKVLFYEEGYMEEGVVPMQVIGERFTASNLIPGRVYIFQVAAVNEYGTGPYFNVRNIQTNRTGMYSIVNML
jgi:hypothetical protein